MFNSFVFNSVKANKQITFYPNLFPQLISPVIQRNVIYQLYSDRKIIYPFNSIKKVAGRETQRLSLYFILIATPSNINKASPPAEISKISWNLKPSNSPNAPTISKIAVSAPAFSSPKRLNSLFIFGDLKYAIPYPIKERLEIKIRAVSKFITTVNFGTPQQ